jgi:cell division septation protein DedD
MKRTDFKRKSSVLYIGKGIIVLTLVVTASLGFVFGFFVGKYFRPPLEKQVTGNHTITDNSVHQPYSPVPESSTAMNNENNLTNTQAPPSNRSTSGDFEKNIGIQKQQDPSAENPAANQTEPGSMEKQSAQENTKISSLDQEKDTLTVSKKKIYAVQVGAFKNPDDANDLKSKFDKKGYTSDLVIANGNNKKIFKILIGKFTSKDAAEKFSNKIKHTENIKAFVVVKQP